MFSQKIQSNNISLQYPDEWEASVHAEQSVEMLIITPRIVNTLPEGSNLLVNGSAISVSLFYDSGAGSLVRLYREFLDASQEPDPVRLKLYPGSPIILESHVTADGLSAVAVVTTVEAEWLNSPRTRWLLFTEQRLFKRIAAGIIVFDIRGWEKQFTEIKALAESIFATLEIGANAIANAESSK